jgi:hypothetical protein
MFCTLVVFSACTGNAEKWIMSPNGKIMVNLRINDKGQPYYDVEYTGMPLISRNLLGLVRDDEDFSENMVYTSVSETEQISDKYSMLHGKQNEIEYIANMKIYHLENHNGKKMDIIFKVSDDGFAFRYMFPDKSNKMHRITSENTLFQFNEKTVAWIQPMSESKSGWKKVHPSYEEHYFNEVKIDSLPIHKPGWVFPALFKSNDFWINITESAPDRNYCGTRLILQKEIYAFRIGFPDSTEHKDKGAVNPQSTLPWSTPWRIVTLSDNLGSLVESTHGTDLAEPSVIDDYSFVKPGRSSWSWVMYKDDSTVFSVQKRFVDYASDMGWEYCLVDADWDRKIGYEKLGELVEYAKAKNVGVIVWYNSAGDWNATSYTPRNKLLTQELREAEFKKLDNMGVKGIKVDFFGADGQSMMRYYQEIFETAAKYKIIVNCHGSTLPRGWHRTYPNLVSMESIRGFEFVTFEQSNADLQPLICAVIPFTRNIFDPMDFTPVCFSEVPGIQRKTTNVFELALSVLFLSGVQHYAEVPEGMSKMSEDIIQIMKDVPVCWDETKFIDGYPADYVVIARRKDNAWYIAGINGKDTEKEIEIDLSFIKNPKNVTFITDNDNNRTCKIDKETVDFAQKLPLKLLPNGGFFYRVEI